MDRFVIWWGGGVATAMECLMGDMRVPTHAAKAQAALTVCLIQPHTRFHIQYNAVGIDPRLGFGR